VGIPRVGPGRVEGPHREGALSAPRAVSASRLFFPLAAAYAALILPASVLPMLGIAPALPGLASPAAHAHEMLFGFALAVVAGHQLGQAGARTLGLLLALWAAARLAFLLAPASLLAVVPNVAFAGALGWHLAPRLFTSAKKLRNLALPLVFTALAGCAGGVELARYLGAAALERALLTTTLVAFSLLMLFMGGRLVAPAAAGQFHRQGGSLDARVQPRIEGAIIGVMIVAAIASAFANRRPLAVFSGVALATGGALALVRLARWRLWATRGRPDLVCIGIGYAWVGAGLAAWGIAGIAGSRELAMLHAITIGGLGTLTLNVMALTAARVARADPSATRLPAVATALLALACVERISADFSTEWRLVHLGCAAVAWSAAFALLLARLGALRRAGR
jgi:uncharacterized protein involved in response to NO